MVDMLTTLLGSAARVKLLRLFLFNPTSFFTLEEICARARVTSASARREVSVLMRAGLVHRHARGKHVRYGLVEQAPHLALIQELLLETTISPAIVAKKLSRAGSIKFVALAGVFTGELSGRLDILVVGDRIDDKVLRLVMRGLEADLGRELRYAMLSSQDFMYRLTMNDRLVRDVFDYPHKIPLDNLNTGLR